MTPQEFKAWFEGFTECMEGTPSRKQWTRIQKRVKQIDNIATTERVFVDRYWPRPWQPYWNTHNVGRSPALETVTFAATSDGTAGNFSSVNAFETLGRNELQRAFSHDGGSAVAQA